MPFNIDGTVVRLSDGTEGTIRQDKYRREPNRHAFVADLRVERPGMPDLHGTLRCTAEADERLPGGDREKSAAVSAKLVERVGDFRLDNGFQLTFDVDDSGVVLDQI